MFTQEITKKIDALENFPDVLEGLYGLVATAKELHAEERNISLISVRLVGLLIEQNAAGNLMMSQERFAWHIGLTPNLFWKRAQVYRVLKNYPAFSKVIEQGEACITHVAMISSKITPANAEIFLEEIKGKSTREVKDLVASVRPDGSRLPPEDTFVDIKLRLTGSQLELLERAREVLAHGGSVPGNEDIFLKAIDDLLDRKDPLRKAERALSAARQENDQEKISADATEQNTSSLKKNDACEETNSNSVKKGITRSRRIPAAIKHFVWKRDNGRCTHTFSDGTPCGSRMMLELDHQNPWARGGTHTPENLTLKCREHNQWAAVQTYGKKFMERHRH